MGKKVKKYVILSIIKTIILYTISILYLTIGMIQYNGSIFFLGLDIICIIMFIKRISNHIFNIKNTKKSDFKKIEKELLDPILIVPFHFILTDTYIVNLRNSHLFKYKDIEFMYKTLEFKPLIRSDFSLVRFLYTITKDQKKDKFMIGNLYFTDYRDFSDIIMKKNIWVNFNKDRK
ncbi:MAG: hypothetical protein IJ068_00400 [Bacilli bacterium]|nr:hypothetical protein [Bacilli bacterium]